jgi:hypothetical protein
MSTDPRPPSDPSAVELTAELVSIEPKPYLQSLTVWGVLVYLVAWGLEALGWDLGPAGVDHILTLILELAQAAGLGGAIVGLRRASRPLAGIVRAPREASDGR